MVKANDAQAILQLLRLIRHSGELTFALFGSLASVLVQATALVEHAEEDGAVRVGDLEQLKELLEKVRQEIGATLNATADILKEPGAQ